MVIRKCKLQESVCSQIPNFRNTCAFILQRRFGLMLAGGVEIGHLQLSYSRVTEGSVQEGGQERTPSFLASGQDL